MTWLRLQWCRLTHDPWHTHHYRLVAIDPPEFVRGGWWCMRCGAHTAEADLW